MKVAAAYEKLIALIRLQHNAAFSQTRMKNEREKKIDKWESGRMNTLFLFSHFQSLKKRDVVWKNIKCVCIYKGLHRNENSWPKPKFWMYFHVHGP